MSRFGVRRSLTALVASALACSLQAVAQNPQALSQFFEGKSVIVQIDMPGSQKGVDINPDKTPSLDTKNYSKRLREFGTALRKGDSVVITKIKVKDDHIEFQLGGGGYGVAGDTTDESVHFTPADKSSHEKDLENQLRNETDPDRRRALSAELDRLRRDREREDRRNQASAERDADRRRDEATAGRASGGSRFNIRLSKNSESASITPQFVMAALASYVYFAPAVFGSDASHPAGAAAAAPDSNGSEQTASPAALKIGMTRNEVEQLFGPAAEAHEQADGSMIKTTCTYKTASEAVTAVFVNGVLVNYSITSR